MTVSLIEKESVITALSSGIRLDSRSFKDYRDISIDFSTLNRGNVSVSIGRTKVHAVITATLDRPFPDRPFEGQMSFFVEYSSTALNLDGFSLVGTRMDEEQFGSNLQRTLEKAFKSSRAVDLESLCVITGQRVWNIRVDIHVIDDDGNVVDAAMIATLTALTDFRRPDVQVTAENEVIVFSSMERHPVPLSMHHFPLSITFGIFNDDNNSNDSSICIADPTNLETCSQSSTMTIVMNRQAEIVYMCKPGGDSVSVDFLLNDLLPVAKDLTLKLSDLVSKAVSSRPQISL